MCAGPRQAAYAHLGWSDTTWLHRLEEKDNYRSVARNLVKRLALPTLRKSEASSAGRSLQVRLVMMTMTSSLKDSPLLFMFSLSDPLS